MTDLASLLVLGAVLAGTALVAVALRAGQGKVRAVHDRFSNDELTRLGVPAGAWALVEMTAPGCTTCRAAQRVLDSVAVTEGDVHVVVVDVSDEPDLARHHHVLRAPTTFVVAPDGTVAGRIGGVPVRDDVVDLLRRDDQNVSALR